MILSKKKAAYEAALKKWAQSTGPKGSIISS